MERLISIAVVMLFGLGAGIAAAQDAPPEPPLPQPRPDDLGPSATPDEAQETEEAQDDTESATDEAARIYQTACPALLTGRVLGRMQPPVSEGQCGLQNPIAVNAVVINGREIALSGAPVTTCAMATALADWAQEVDAHARAVLGSGIEQLATGPGYQCRLRYGAEAGFLSEHGRGNALDIAAISFENGERVSVLEDWQRLPVSGEAKFLAFAHGAACARFTTVLGPEANDDHEDHFHFDLGCHGQSCTAVICE